jgi:hypothetical protein
MENKMSLFSFLGLVEKYLHLLQKYKEIFVFWAGPVPLVILGSPEYVQVRQWRDVSIIVVIIYR